MRRNNGTLVVVLLLLLIGVGYAILSNTLNINGTAKIPATSWDVHFENVVATSLSNTTPTVAPSASAASKVTTLTYDVTLNNPGDIYEFNVDVKNAGSIDAMLNSISSQIKIGSGSWQTVSSSTIPAYLLYSVTYSDGVSIKSPDSLEAGDSETLLVHVEFNKNITEEQLEAATGQTLSFKITMDYAQADGTEYPSHNFVYTVGTSTMNIGSAIPSGVTTRTTVTDALADWSSTAYTCLKHNLDKDEKITDSFVVFVVTNSHVSSNPGMVAGTYSLKGVDKAFYSGNAEILKNAFDVADYPTRCNYTNQASYQCTGAGQLKIQSHSTGQIGINIGHKCHTYTDGSSVCSN